MSQELLTWKKATVQLAWKDGGTPAAGRRLKRAVLAREAETGKQIATRLKRDGQRIPLRITMSAIMRWLPELRRSRVDSLSAALAEYRAETGKLLREMISGQIAEHVEPRLDELWGRDEVLAAQVEAVAKDVYSLTEAVSIIQGHRQNKTA